MHLYPHVTELRDGVRKPHENDAGPHGSDRIDVVATHVEIDHVMSQILGHPVQEYGRLRVRGLSSGGRSVWTGGRRCGGFRLVARPADVA